MSEMVDRVAKVIAVFLPSDVAAGVTRFSPGEYKTLNPGVLGITRAVIAAMREPTQEMEAAAEIAMDRLADSIEPPVVSYVMSTGGSDVYRAMIDAALK